MFTTGGIGPTHDDITADCVAKAFGVADRSTIRDAVALLKQRFAAAELNEARMRMARIPAGAELVANKVSIAPGFWIGNVIVMAGVPTIMQAMLDECRAEAADRQEDAVGNGAADAREGDIGTPLGEIAKAFPDAMIGSYPFFDEQKAEHQYRGALARAAECSLPRRRRWRTC